jgi:molecular chaperone DnaJ
MANHYQVLNVATTDPHDVIKKAFQRIALTHHPDKTRNLPASERNAKEEKFKAANNAWETLSDATKRSAYDRSLSRESSACNDCISSTNFNICEC